MIDYEKLIIDLNKCIYVVNIDLKLALLHLSKKRSDMSFEYLLDAQRWLRRIEELFP